MTPSQVMSIFPLNLAKKPDLVFRSRDVSFSLNLAWRLNCCIGHVTFIFPLHSAKNARIDKLTDKENVGIWGLPMLWMPSSSPDGTLYRYETVKKVLCRRAFPHRSIIKLSCSQRKTYPFELGWSERSFSEGDWDFPPLSKTFSRTGSRLIQPFLRHPSLCWKRIESFRIAYRSKCKRCQFALALRRPRSV